jgi:hypothetical protein
VSARRFAEHWRPARTAGMVVSPEGAVVLRIVAPPGAILLVREAAGYYDEGRLWSTPSDWTALSLSREAL